MQTRRWHRLGEATDSEMTQTRRKGADSENRPRLGEEEQTWRRGADSEKAQTRRRYRPGKEEQTRRRSRLGDGADSGKRHRRVFAISESAPIFRVCTLFMSAPSPSLRHLRVCTFFMSAPSPTNLFLFRTCLFRDCAFSESVPSQSLRHLRVCAGDDSERPSPAKSFSAQSADSENRRRLGEEARTRRIIADSDMAQTRELFSNFHSATRWEFGSRHSDRRTWQLDEDGLPSLPYPGDDSDKGPASLPASQPC